MEDISDDVNEYFCALRCLWTVCPCYNNQYKLRLQYEPGLDMKDISADIYEEFVALRCLGTVCP